MIVEKVDLFLIKANAFFKKYYDSNKKAAKYFLIALLVITNSFFTYGPVFTGFYWGLAVTTESSDFSSSIYFFQKAYEISGDEFFRDERVREYINEATKFQTSDPDKALSLLEECYYYKANDEVASLISTICISQANAYLKSDIHRAVSYIEKGFVYSQDDNLINAAITVYTELANIEGLNSAMLAIDRLTTTDQIKNMIKSGVQLDIDLGIKNNGNTSALNPNVAAPSIATPFVYPADASAVASLYLNSLSKRDLNVARLLEYFGDRIDLYFENSNLLAGAFIPTTPDFTISTLTDITASYSPTGNESFFSVIYNSDGSSIEVYVMLIMSAGFWKVYGIA